MGSNRGKMKDEVILRFVKEILSVNDINNWKWQNSIGAEIRGRLGIEKGNEFIKKIREVKL